MVTAACMRMCLVFRGILISVGLFACVFTNAQNLIRNPSFDACYSYYDLNHNLVYQPVDWFYIDSPFNHSIYFSTDRYLNNSLPENLHPDSAIINRGGISNYLSIMIFPGVQKPYTALLQPLKADAKYRISMDIKAMVQSNYFSDILMGFKVEPGPILDSCLYHVKLVIPDSLCTEQLYEKWITLSTEFTAIGNEKLLVVNSGSLKAYREIIDANPEKFQIERFQGPPKLKYFIDNITLREITLPSETTTVFDSLKTGDRVILNNIYFDFDKSEIRETSCPELEEVYHYLDLHRNIRILISGHTDNFGSDAYNAALSENRARAVVTYLENRGISPDRMQSKGFGATLPIATNATSAGRQNNRRIEMQIIP